MISLGYADYSPLTPTSVTVYGSMYLLDIELNIGTTLGVLVILALSSSGFMTILLVTLISPWFFASIVPQPAVQEGEQPRGGAVPG